MGGDCIFARATQAKEAGSTRSRVATRTFVDRNPNIERARKFTSSSQSTRSSRYDLVSSHEEWQTGYIARSRLDVAAGTETFTRWDLISHPGDGLG